MYRLSHKLVIIASWILQQGETWRVLVALFLYGQVTCTLAVEVILASEFFTAYMNTFVITNMNTG